MNDDLLTRATASLRGSTAPSLPGQRGEIERIVAEVRVRARRRRRLLLLMMQIAALTLGAGAWAAASGRLSRVLAHFTPATIDVAPVPRPPARGRAPVNAAPAAAEPAVMSGAPPAAPVLPAPPRGGARPAAAPVTGAPHAADLYRLAHEAHFVRRDWAAAVRAWDHYLAADKTGQLVPEARFNRALALARLGRTQEAADALQLFADGEYGSYRQDDARRLLQHLTARP